MLCKRSGLCRSAGLLGRVRSIDCFLFSCTTSECIVQCRPLLLDQALRVSLYIAYSCRSHTSAVDPHGAPHTEPHPQGMTCCLLLARLYAQHDPRSRLTKWENKGVFCPQHNPLPFLLGQPDIMVAGQD